MNIASAQYVAMATDGTNINPQASIKTIIDGKEMFVPIDNGNVHYAKIMRQVDAGELTIADAD